MKNYLQVNRALAAEKDFNLIEKQRGWLSRVICMLVLLFSLGVGQTWAWYVKSPKDSWSNHDMGGSSEYTYYDVPAGNFYFIINDNNGSESGDHNMIENKGTWDDHKSLKSTDFSTENNQVKVILPENSNITIKFTGNNDNWKIKVFVRPAYYFKYYWGNESEWKWSGWLVRCGAGLYATEGNYRSSETTFNYNSRPDDSGKADCGTINVSGSPGNNTKCFFIYDSNSSTRSLTIEEKNSTEGHNYMFFDNTNAGWSDTYIQVVLGHLSYSRAYTMSKLGGSGTDYTNLYYVDRNDNDWTGDGCFAYFGMVGTDDDYDDGAWASNSIYDANHHSAPLYQHQNLGSNYNYLISKADNVNGHPITVEQKGNAYGSLNFTQTVKYQLSKNGGAYSDMSASDGKTPATITASSYKFNDRTTVTSSSLDNPLIVNTTTLYSSTVTAAYTGKTTLTVSNVRPGYKFVGWYVGNTCKETATSYTYRPTDATVVTARFQKLYAYVEGRFRVYDKTQSVRTSVGGQGSWVKNSANIPMTYDDANGRFVLHTYSTPEDLKAAFTGGAGDADPWFFIKTSTSSSSISSGDEDGPVEYWATAEGDAYQKLDDGTGYSNGKACTGSSQAFTFVGNSGTTGYVVLYCDGAKVWYELEYKVTFGYGRGGTGVTASGSTTGSISSGDYVFAGEDVTFTKTNSSGYSFYGWYTAASGGSTVGTMGVSDDILNSISANANVYARFEPSAGSGLTVFKFDVSTTSGNVCSTTGISTINESNFSTLEGGYVDAYVSGTTQLVYATGGYIRVSGSTNPYLILNLDCPLKEGDVIKWYSAASSSRNLYFRHTSSATSTGQITLQVPTSAASQTTRITDAFDGVSTIYITVSGQPLDIKSIEIIRPYSITLDANTNGGTVNGDETIEATADGSTYFPRAIKSGYRFKGWYTESSGGDLITEPYLSPDGATLYAQFDECATPGTVFSFQLKTGLTNASASTTGSYFNVNKSNYLATMYGGTVQGYAYSADYFKIVNNNAIRFGDNIKGRLKINLDCAIQAGDTIKSSTSGSSGAKMIIAVGETDDAVQTLEQGANAKAVVVSDLVDKSTIYIRRKESKDVQITAFEIIRPAHYTITHTLTNVTTSSDDEVIHKAGYTATYAADDGYTLPSTITVERGVTDITSNCTWVQGTGTLTIPAADCIGDITITVTGEESSCSAPTSASISGVTEYYAGQTISLTASASGTDESTTYQWFKGDPTDDDVSQGDASTSGATFTKASCVVGDAATYYCIISNGTGCETTVNETVTVGYRVTYDDNDASSGTAPSAAIYANGAEVTVADNDDDLAKTGYDDLAYWNTADDGSGTDYAIGSGTFDISANTPLYAKWTQTITLDKNGGGSNTNATAVWNAAGPFAPAATQTYSGHTLYDYRTSDGTSVLTSAGAFKATNVSDKSSVVYISGGKWAHEAAPTLYAHWQCNTPTISFSDDATNTVTISVPSGTTVYYTDNGEDPTSSDTEYTAPFTIAADKTIKAIAVHDGCEDSEIAEKECEYVASYTITHSTPTNGSYTIKVGDADAVGTNTSSIADKTITLTATPSSGYVFDHWTTSGTSVTLSNANVSPATFTMPAGNVTVNAVFKATPNIYYYKDATHYSAGTYKNPETETASSGDDKTLTTPWTICDACVTGVTKVEATNGTYDGKGNHMNAYIKVPKGGDEDEKNIIFTIAEGYKATISMKIGGYSSNPSVTLKSFDGESLGSDITKTTGYATVGGVATTENNFNEIRWSNLSAGKYILNVTSQNAYISEIDIQTESLGNAVSAVTSDGSDTYGTVASADARVAEGGTTTITASPATGYKVTNWAVSGEDASIDPSGASNSNTTTLTMGSEDATVTVTFGAKTYTLTLDKNGGSADGEAVATYNSHTLASITDATCSLTHYSLDGYYTAADGGVKIITSIQTLSAEDATHDDELADWLSPYTGGNWIHDAEETLYAHWYLNITLNHNADHHGTGTYGSATAIYNGSSLKAISHTTGESGYTLLGYYTTADGGTKILNADGSFAATNITGYVTGGKWTYSGSDYVILYAHWGKEFTVTYNGNDNTSGSVPAAVENQLFGTEITVAGNTGSLAKTGETFVGWNSKSDGTGAYFTVGSTFTLTQDTTLYAMWQECGGGGATTIYDVTASGYTSYIEIGGTNVIFTSTPSLGFKYNSPSGWVNESTTSTTRNNAYKCQIKSSSSNRGSLKTNNAYSNVDSISFYFTAGNTSGKIQVLYSTDGFVKDSTELLTPTKIHTNSSEFMKKTLTLPAAKKANSLTFRFRFAPSGASEMYIDSLKIYTSSGSGSTCTIDTVAFDNMTGFAGSATLPDSLKNVPHGSKIAEPIIPSADGYVFGGWYKEGACTNAWNFATEEVSEKITLYAKWINVSGKYTFHYGGGEPTDNTWMIVPFTREGTSIYYNIEDFIVPNTTKYPSFFVGYEGAYDTENAKSTIYDWDDTYTVSAKIYGRMPIRHTGTSDQSNCPISAPGQMADSAKGTLRITVSDLGVSTNCYVGFIPSGYALDWNRGTTVLHATPNPKVFETDTFKLKSADVSGNFEVKLATEDGYVTYARTAEEDLDDLGDRKVSTETYDIEAGTIGRFQINLSKTDNNFGLRFVPLVNRTKNSGNWETDDNWTLWRRPTIDEDAYITNYTDIRENTARAKKVIIDKTAGGTYPHLNIQSEYAGVGGLLVAEHIQVLKEVNETPTLVDDVSYSELSIKSSEYGSGSLIMGDASTTTSGSVELYTKACYDDGWVNQYIGSPISDGSIYDFYGSYLYVYGPANDEWLQANRQASYAVPAFKAYNIMRGEYGPGYYSLYGKMVFPGTEGDGRLKVLTCDDENPETDAEHNRIGTYMFANSWTAPIDVKAMEISDFVGAEAVIYIFNAGTPAQAADTANDATAPGQWVSLPVAATAVLENSLPLTVIPSMQAFSFETTEATASLTLDYNKHVYEPALGSDSIEIKPLRAPRRGVGYGKPNVLQIFVEGESGYKDNLYILERGDFSEDFDNGWDGRKIFGVSAAPQIYGISGESQMAIDAVPDMEGKVVGFKAGTADDEYAVTFDYNGDDVWFFNDTKEQTATLITNETEYYFITEAGDNDNRFYISRTPYYAPQVTTGSEEIEQPNEVHKVLVNDHIYILRGGRIYSVDGQMVK